jgi:hypothetical protein
MLLRHVNATRDAVPCRETLAWHEDLEIRKPVPGFDDYCLIVLETYYLQYIVLSENVLQNVTNVNKYLYMKNLNKNKPLFLQLNTERATKLFRENIKLCGNTK